MEKMQVILSDMKFDLAVLAIAAGIVAKNFLGSRDFRQALARGGERAIGAILREIDPFVRPALMQRLSRDR